MRNKRTQSRYSRSHAETNRENIYGGYDYRKAYFKQNRGIFGYLYICSQCMKPMANKTTIQVDHIVPPSRFAGKKRKWGKDTGKRKATLISNCLNNTFNCVTICGKCNVKKGNKIDHRVAKGVAAKSIELGLKTIQFAAASALWLSLHLVRVPFIGAGWVFKRAVRSKKP